MGALLSFRQMKSNRFGRLFCALALPLAAPFAIAAAVPGTAMAAESCEFFKGKTVELVVPFWPGGGFDVYGRLVAKFMGDELGAANMIVRDPRRRRAARHQPDLEGQA